MTGVQTCALPIFTNGFCEDIAEAVPVEEGLKLDFRSVMGVEIHVLTTKAGLFGFIAPMALAAIPEDKQPAACLHCGSCEQVCPQQIKISDVMGDFVKVLGGPSE